MMIQLDGTPNKGRCKPILGVSIAVAQQLTY